MLHCCPTAIPPRPHSVHTLCSQASANDEFKRGENERALGAYLAAIWMLKPDNPPSPNALASAIWAVRPDDPLRPPNLIEGSEVKGFEGVLLLGEGNVSSSGSGEW